MKRNIKRQVISCLLVASLAVSAAYEEAQTEPFIIPEKSGFSLKLEQSRRKNGKKENM